MKQAGKNHRKVRKQPAVGDFLIEANKEKAEKIKAPDSTKAITTNLLVKNHT